VNPTLGEFVVGLDGREVGGAVLRTARDAEGEPGRREAASEVRFAKLRLVERLFHTAALPSVAYVLLMAGLLLLVFEFFSAGIGVAGAVGAGALVLAGYGLAVLPTDPVGLGLLVVAVFGFSVDVQAGAPRAWTVIGTGCLIAGSLLLYDEGLAVPWLTLVLVVAGVVLFMVSGMTSMLRARFSTATIGRESMIGEMGQATTGMAPEGMVALQGGLWRARTNRATPIANGDPVRVVAIDGLLLEVEPEEGGARDAGH
jgi:membrane-bound serine protease (ClpP class)